MRRNAREAVFILLYRDLFLTEKDESFIKKIYAENSLTAEDEIFAGELYATVKNNENEIASIISTYSSGFDFTRLFLTDKCALEIGVAELKYFGDVPEIVAIDEAVSLSRKFSADKSPSFVNGVLASYKKALDESGAERCGKSSLTDVSVEKTAENTSEKIAEKPAEESIVSGGESDFAAEGEKE